MNKPKLPTEEPLVIHFYLKRSGSSLSDIARRASRGRLVITPANVRGVLYGYTRKNAKPILATIEIVLRRAAPRELPSGHSTSVTG